MSGSKRSRFTFVFVLVVLAASCVPGFAQTRPQAPQQAVDAAFLKTLSDNEAAALKALEGYCYNQNYLYEKLSETDEVQRRDYRTEVLCHEEGGVRSRALSINGKPTGASDDERWPPLVKDQAWLKRRSGLAERNARWLQLVSEVPKAALFTRLGDEVIDGRHTTHFLLTPNPQYKPFSRVTEMLTHLKGQAWIDMKAVQMVRMIVINESDFDLMGGLILKVRKGGSYDMRQLPFNGVWLPWYQEERWHARIALFKNVGQHQKIERSKFRPTATVMAQKTEPRR